MGCGERRVLRVYSIPSKLAEQIRRVADAEMVSRSAIARDALMHVKAQLDGQGESCIFMNGGPDDGKR